MGHSGSNVNIKLVKIIIFFATLDLFIAISANDEGMEKVLLQVPSRLVHAKLKLIIIETNSSCNFKLRLSFAS